VTTTLTTTSLRTMEELHEFASILRITGVRRSARCLFGAIGTVGVLLLRDANIDMTKPKPKTKTETETNDGTAGSACPAEE
jgi:hypothetical protein